MPRLETAIFASATPVPREAIVRLVGRDCRLVDLTAEFIQALRGRPYDLVQVAAGFALRAKAGFTPAIRVTNPRYLPGNGLSDLTGWRRLR